MTKLLQNAAVIVKKATAAKNVWLHTMKYTLVFLTKSQKVTVEILILSCTRVLYLRFLMLKLSKYLIIGTNRST